ncbi:MAG: hypothetical protein RLZZ111_1822 [Planctomycetota bacterium]|jgi:hypothetical protein
MQSHVRQQRAAQLPLGAEQLEPRAMLAMQELLVNGDFSANDAQVDLNGGSRTIFYKDTDGKDYSMSFASFNSKFNWNFGAATNAVAQSLGVVNGTIIV